MNRIKITTLIITILFSVIQSFSQDGTSLLKKMDAVLSAPKDRTGTIEIVLINKSGKEKVREAEMMQKGRDKKIYRYTKPESQAGIATLSLPDGVMWLYIPAIGKPKKISMLAKSQAFNGTDFSTEDMDTRPYPDRFTARLTETTDKGYVLELTPKSDKSQYSKIILTIDKSGFLPETMVYYDKSGRKYKEATYKYKKSGNYWYAEEVTMKDLKKNHTTKIKLSNVKFDQGLTDDEFTVEKLKPADNKE
jgi:outer membrane lipoprotein-sorting protein